jgi:UPF0755 protein
VKILKLLILVVFFAFLGAAGFVSGAYLWVEEMAQSAGSGQKTELLIEPGTNTRQIATLLKQKNVVRSALLFRLYIRFLAVDQRLKPGQYSFAGDESLNEVIFKLLRGSLQTVPVTIPEGLTIKQVAAILEEAGICEAVKFIEAVSDPILLGKVFSNWDLIPAAEGLVFPDTYYFNRPTQAYRVAERMLRLMKHQIDRIFTSPLPGGLSQYQGCILASIVEEESALPQERNLIASVFYNRLAKQIKLESCATVLYALGSHKTRLLFEDLKVDSPFNTYLYPGLPPTPIANFGTSALAAVASPADSDFLFFVSDGNRGHKFSKSLNEHNRFRHQFYQKRRKAEKN